MTYHRAANLIDYAFSTLHLKQARLTNDPRLEDLEATYQFTGYDIKKHIWPNDYNKLSVQSARIQNLYSTMAAMLNRIRPLNKGELPKLIAPIPDLGFTSGSAARNLYSMFDESIKEYANKGYQINLPSPKNVNICDVSELVGYYERDGFTSFFKENQSALLLQWVLKETDPKNPLAHRVSDGELLRETMKLCADQDNKTVDMFKVIATIGHYYKSMARNPNLILGGPAARGAEDGYEFIHKRHDNTLLLAWALDPDVKNTVDENGLPIISCQSVDPDGSWTSGSVSHYNSEGAIYHSWNFILTSLYATAKSFNEIKTDLQKYFETNGDLESRVAAQKILSNGTVSTKLYNPRESSFIHFILFGKEIIMRQRPATLDTARLTLVYSYMKQLGLDEFVMLQTRFGDTEGDSKERAKKVFAGTGERLQELCKTGAIESIELSPEIIISGYEGQSFRIFEGGGISYETYYENTMAEWKRLGKPSFQDWEKQDPDGFEKAFFAFMQIERIREQYYYNGSIKIEIPYDLQRAGGVIKSNALIQGLAANQQWTFRRAAAKNRNTPEEVLEHLSRDKDIDVKLAVALNPNTPTEALREMKKDDNGIVRFLAAINPSAPADILIDPATDPAPKFLYDFTSNDPEDTGDSGHQYLDDRFWQMQTDINVLHSFIKSHPGLELRITPFIIHEYHIPTLLGDLEKALKEVNHDGTNTLKILLTHHYDKKERKSVLEINAGGKKMPVGLNPGTPAFRETLKNILKSLATPAAAPALRSPDESKPIGEVGNPAQRPESRLTPLGGSTAYTGAGTVLMLLGMLSVSPAMILAGIAVLAAPLVYWLIRHYRTTAEQFPAPSATGIVPEPAPAQATAPVPSVSTMEAQQTERQARIKAADEARRAAEAAARIAASQAHQAAKTRAKMSLLMAKGLPAEESAKVVRLQDELDDLRLQAINVKDDPRLTKELDKAMGDKRIEIERLMESTRAAGKITGKIAPAPSAGVAAQAGRTVTLPKQFNITDANAKELLEEVLGMMPKTAVDRIFKSVKGFTYPDFKHQPDGVGFCSEDGVIQIGQCFDPLDFIETALHEMAHAIALKSGSAALAHFYSDGLALYMLYPEEFRAVAQKEKEENGEWYQAYEFYKNEVFDGKEYSKEEAQHIRELINETRTSYEREDAGIVKPGKERLAVTARHRNRPSLPESLGLVAPAPSVPETAAKPEVAVPPAAVIPNTIESTYPITITRDDTRTTWYGKRGRLLDDDLNEFLTQQLHLSQRSDEAAKIRKALAEMLNNAYDAIMSYYDNTWCPQGPKEGYAGRIETRFLLNKSNNMAIFEVTDNGMGKDAADNSHKQAVHEIYTGGAGEGGANIGMIAEEMKGTFEPPNGTPTVTRLAIPLANLKLAQPPAPSTVAEKSAYARHQVRAALKGVWSGHYRELQEHIVRFATTPSVFETVRNIGEGMHISTASFNEAAGEIFTAAKLVELAGKSPKDQSPLGEILCFSVIVPEDDKTGKKREIDFLLFAREGNLLGLDEGLYFVEAKEDARSDAGNAADVVEYSQIQGQIQSANWLGHRGIDVKGIIVAIGGPHMPSEKMVTSSKIWGDVYRISLKYSVESETGEVSSGTNLRELEETLVNNKVDNILTQVEAWKDPGRKKTLPGITPQKHKARFIRKPQDKTATKGGSSPEREAGAWAAIFKEHSVELSLSDVHKILLAYFNNGAYPIQRGNLQRQLAAIKSDIKNIPGVSVDEPYKRLWDRIAAAAPAHAPNPRHEEVPSGSRPSAVAMPPALTLSTAPAAMPRALFVRSLKVLIGSYLRKMTTGKKPVKNSIDGSVRKILVDDEKEDRGAYELIEKPGWLAHGRVFDVGMNNFVLVREDQLAGGVIVTQNLQSCTGVCVRAVDTGGNVYYGLAHIVKESPDNNSVLAEEIENIKEKMLKLGLGVDKMVVNYDERFYKDKPEGGKALQLNARGESEQGNLVVRAEGVTFLPYNGIKAKMLPWATLSENGIANNPAAPNPLLATTETVTSSSGPVTQKFAGHIASKELIVTLAQLAEYGIVFSEISNLTPATLDEFIFNKANTNMQNPGNTSTVGELAKKIKELLNRVFRKYELATTVTVFNEHDNKPHSVYVITGPRTDILNVGDTGTFSYPVSLGLISTPMAHIVRAEAAKSEVSSTLMAYVRVLYAAVQSLFSDMYKTETEKYIFIPLSDKLCKYSALHNMAQRLWHTFRLKLNEYKIGNIKVILYDGSIDDLRSKLDKEKMNKKELKKENTFIFIDGTGNDKDSCKEFAESYSTARDVAPEEGKGYVSIGGHIALGIGLLELHNKQNQNETYRKAIVGLIRAMQHTDKIKDDTSIEDLKSMIEQGTLEIKLPPIEKEPIDKNMDELAITEQKAMEAV